MHLESLKYLPMGQDTCAVAEFVRVNIWMRINKSNDVCKVMTDEL